MSCDGGLQYIAATLAYGVSDDRFCTSSARGKGFENVETTVWYDAGQNGSSNSTVWEWEEFVRFRIDPGGVFYFLINPPTVVRVPTRKVSGEG